MDIGPTWWKVAQPQGRKMNEKIYGFYPVSEEIFEPVVGRGGFCVGVHLKTVLSRTLPAALFTTHTLSYTAN